jgi:hypothetical protein
MVAAPLGIPISVEATPAVKERHLAAGSFPNETEVGEVFKCEQALRKITEVSARAGDF